MARQSSRIAVLLLAILLALAAVIVVLVLVVTGVIPVSSGSGGSQTAGGASPAGSLTPMQVFEKDAPGVVEVRAGFSASGDSPAGQGLGTGFLVSKDGYLLTNAHVVTNDLGRDAASVVAVFRAASGASPSDARVTATIVGSDLGSDIAVLKIDPGEAPSLHVLPLATGETVQVGEPVVAIGNPLGLSFTLTSGIVSATGRNLRSPNDSVIPDGIQTDAAINSGNSGGPLIDSAGRVIGVNTQIISQSGGSQGLGFAVSIDTAVNVMDQLKTSGSVANAYLGASGQTLTPELAAALGATPDHGVLVARVGQGSPAAEAGIRGGTHQITLQGQPFIVGGDVITAMDSAPIASTTDLAAAVARHAPGDVVTLTLFRDAQQLELKATLAQRP
jgi:S1-C subfamily serine protease